MPRWESVNRHIYKDEVDKNKVFKDNPQETADNTYQTNVKIRAKLTGIYAPKTDGPNPRWSSKGIIVKNKGLVCDNMGLGYDYNTVEFRKAYYYVSMFVGTDKPIVCPKDKSGKYPFYYGYVVDFAGNYDSKTLEAYKLMPHRVGTVAKSKMRKPSVSSPAVPMATIEKVVEEAVVNAGIELSKSFNLALFSTAVANRMVTEGYSNVDDITSIVSIVMEEFTKENAK